MGRERIVTGLPLLVGAELAQPFDQLPHGWPLDRLTDLYGVLAAALFDSDVPGSAAVEVSGYLLGEVKKPCGTDELLETQALGLAQCSRIKRNCRLDPRQEHQSITILKSDAHAALLPSGVYYPHLR